MIKFIEKCIAGKEIVKSINVDEKMIEFLEKINIDDIKDLNMKMIDGWHDDDGF